LNPLESPDPIINNASHLKGLKLEKRFIEARDNEVMRLRDQRISEVINETSDFES